MARKDRISIRDRSIGDIDLEELEDRLEAQRLPVTTDDYCSLNVCSGDCSEGVWCSGGFCECDGRLCVCQGDCPAFCYDYCQDGGGW